MAPRYLETLGFSAVYDYTAGKADRLAAGLPTEGTAVRTLHSGALARTGVPTCTSDKTLTTARRRLATSGEDRYVVTSDGGVVPGVLDQSVLAGDDDARAVDAMRAGPAAVRAHEDLHELVGRRYARGVVAILVTDTEGRLFGLLHHDADAVLAQAHQGGRRTPGDAPGRGCSHVLRRLR
jgi:CBS domain-containing protein